MSKLLGILQPGAQFLSTYGLNTKETTIIRGNSHYHQWQVNQGLWVLGKSIENRRK